MLDVKWGSLRALQYTMEMVLCMSVCVCVCVHVQTLSLYSVQQCLIFLYDIIFLCVFFPYSADWWTQDLELRRL